MRHVAEEEVVRKKRGRPLTRHLANKAAAARPGLRLDQPLSLQQTHGLPDCPLRHAKPRDQLGLTGKPITWLQTAFDNPILNRICDMQRARASGAGNWLV